MNAKSIAGVLLVLVGLVFGYRALDCKASVGCFLNDGTIILIIIVSAISIIGGIALVLMSEKSK